MSILSVNNISPIGSGTSVTINSAATLVLNNANSSGIVTTTQLAVTGISTFTGDVNVGTSQASGIILTSPNGTKYRLIVANDGTLSTTAA